MTQLRLPLGLSEEREVDFLVTSSNARAVQQLEHWATWPVMAALIVGPRKSGRSLLARIFAAKSGGTMIDDAERADETEIFHAWNRAQAERRPLILVSETAPPEWKIRLPDLRSRLAATPVLRLESPDDALVTLLLQRFLDRRLLVAKPEVIDWIGRRVERSHLTLIRVADAIEAECERRKTSRLTVPIARAALEDAGLLVEQSPREQS